MELTNRSRSNACRWMLSTLGCAFVMNASVDAQANEPHYRLDFSAPANLPNCNDPAGFRAVLDMALSRALLEEPHARVLEVRVDKPNGGDHVVNIALKELDGRVRKERQQTYPRSMECFKVLHFAALLTALDLEIDSPAPAKPPPPQCPVCEVPPPPPPKREPPERRWFVGFGGSTVLGLAPATVVGLQLAAGWSWSSSWSAEIDVRGTFPADALPGRLTPIRVQSVGSVTVAPCYRFAPFGLCALVVGTNMWLESSGITRPGVDTVQTLGAGPRGFLEHRFSARWSVRLDADLVAPLVLTTIGDRAAHERARSTPITGAASATLFLSF